MPDCYDLVQLSDDALGRLDLAETNLLCALGLPGAEGLDIPECLAWVDRLAALLREKTERLLPAFRRRPADFNHSEAYFRMLVLMTFFQRDLGVRAFPLGGYWNCADCAPLFIHGVMRHNKGACSSLPVLYTAVGRRLGYPLTLASTAHHLFARWEGPSGERFNVECTVLGLSTPPDEHYLSFPESVSPALLQAGGYLKTKTPREALAGFLISRAYCLRYNDRHKEAVEAALGAHIAAPHIALHYVTATQFMGDWKAWLSFRMPPGFPVVEAHPSPKRRFPATISWHVEREVIQLDAAQTILEDRGNEERWWRHLREPWRTRPRHVPIRLDVSAGDYRPFGAGSAGP
jgi:hypothetical protein